MSGRFTDNGDNTVSDLANGLMWMKSDSMNDRERWTNYIEGVDYVRDLNTKQFAGYGDWRLPTRDEMATLYDEALQNTDKFGKVIHISECFAAGGGFSIFAQLVSGRPRTWVLNLRDGQFSQPDGVWTMSDATRAVRSIAKS
jgi:hypothetical protein